MAHRHLSDSAGPAGPAATTAHANKVLRLIAVFKFLEALVVVAGGLMALKLLDPAAIDHLTHWTQALPDAAAQRFAQGLLNHLSGISHQQIKALGAGAFLFAGIFLLEGIGLWLETRWAEWLAVVATSLFVPLEILELFHHASAPKTIALVVNLLVVLYLVLRIIRTPDSRTAPAPQR